MSTRARALDPGMRIVAITRAMTPVSSLTEVADPADPLVWSRHGDGFTGRGRLLELRFGGASRIDEAAEAWRALTAGALVDVEPGVSGAGTGLIAFGAFAFAADSEAPSSLIVPETVIGRRGDTGFITRISIAPASAAGSLASTPASGDEDAPPSPFDARLTPDPADVVRVPVEPHTARALPDTEASRAGFRAAVARAGAELAAGAYEKIVLARQRTLRADVDARDLVDRLAAAYPTCWTFAVDGFIGASPETLIRVADRQVNARVLAGTERRGATPEEDARIERETLVREKNLREHEIAVRSAIESLSHLAGLGDHDDPGHGLTASREPFALPLANVWHLASDIRATLADDASVLDLAAQLHPTAAVGGTPTAVAVARLRELEGFDRGRYAGPVGWCDARGDGEWAVGLRSAELSDGELTATAGGGIVRGSDPEVELAETDLKFRPIAEALG